MTLLIYDTLTRKQLITICKKRKISGYHAQNKNDLISHIRQCGAHKTILKYWYKKQSKITNRHTFQNLDARTIRGLGKLHKIKGYYKESIPVLIDQLVIFLAKKRIIHAWWNRYMHVNTDCPILMEPIPNLKKAFFFVTSNKKMILYDAEALCKYFIHSKKFHDPTTAEKFTADNVKILCAILRRNKIKNGHELIRLYKIQRIKQYFRERFTDGLFHINEEGGLEIIINSDTDYYTDMELNAILSNSDNENGAMHEFQEFWIRIFQYFTQLYEIRQENMH